MDIKDVVILILFLVWVVTYPTYQDRKIVQFIMLIIMPFIISYLIFDAFNRNIEFSFSMMGLIGIFLIGMLNNAVRFYNNFLRNH